MAHQMHELARGLPIWPSASCPRGRGRGRRVRFMHLAQIDVVFVRRVHRFDVKGAGPFPPIGRAAATRRPADNRPVADAASGRSAEGVVLEHELEPADLGAEPAAHVCDKLRVIGDARAQLHRQGRPTVPLREVHGDPGTAGA